LADLAKDAADRLIKGGSFLDPLDLDVSQGLPLQDERHFLRKLRWKENLNEPIRFKNTDDVNPSQGDGPQVPPINP
jgi:hypothetical protein